MKPHLLQELGIDPHAEAVLLLSELDELIYYAVTEVYGINIHSGIKAVPEIVWNSDAARHNIEYARDLRSLDRSLSRVGPERTLTRKGIEWLGLNYCSESVSGLLNDLLPRAPRRGNTNGGVKVKFKYFPEDISKISIWNDVRRTYVDVDCVEKNYTSGLSEHSHNIIRKYAEDRNLSFSSVEDRCAARSRLNAKIQEFVGTRQIGSRKRAARFTATPQTVSQQAIEVPLGPITFIDTVTNRTSGVDIDRTAARSRSKRAGANRDKSTKQREYSKPPTPPVHEVRPENPFDNIDWDTITSDAPSS